MKRNAVQSGFSATIPFGRWQTCPPSPSVFNSRDNLRGRRPVWTSREASLLQAWNVAFRQGNAVFLTNFGIHIIFSENSWTRSHIGLTGQTFTEALMKMPSTWGRLVENSRWFESTFGFFKTVVQETRQRGRQGSLPSCSREPSGKVTGCDVCGSGKKVKHSVEQVQWTTDVGALRHVFYSALESSLWCHSFSGLKI